MSFLLYPPLLFYRRKKPLGLFFFERSILGPCIYQICNLQFSLQLFNLQSFNFKSFQSTFLLVLLRKNRISRICNWYIVIILNKQLSNKIIFFPFDQSDYVFITRFLLRTSIPLLFCRYWIVLWFFNGFCAGLLDSDKINELSTLTWKLSFTSYVSKLFTFVFLIFRYTPNSPQFQVLKF